MRRRWPDPTSLAKTSRAVQRYALLNRDDVVLTPHMAFYSREALHRLMQVTCGNIREFLRGEPRNTVS